MITKKILVLAFFQGVLSGILCQCWSFPSRIVALNQFCVEIPCSLHPANEPGLFGVVWYVIKESNALEIYNSKDNMSVEEDYINRTMLIPGNNSCTLRIDPVNKNDDGKYYFPGIAGDRWKNAYWTENRLVQIQVTDSPRDIEMYGYSSMIEGSLYKFECSVEHTCGSSPPFLKFNKPGQIERRSEDLSNGKWKEILVLGYNASHEDDRTELNCMAAYHNSMMTWKKTTLDIRYAPKDVTVDFSNNKEVKEGIDVILECSSRSNPSAYKYEWYKGNEKVKLGFWLKNEKIKVLNVSRKTAAFSCVAINDIGQGKSPSVKIPLPFAPTGVQLVELSPSEGANELKCTFERSRPNVTHYTWMKDGIIILNETSEVLVLNQNKDNSGSYSCIAHNFAGSSTSAELELKGKTDADGDYLLVILGGLAGLILLILLVLLFYVLIGRRKSKSIPESSPIHEVIKPKSHLQHIMDEDKTSMQEHEYGNIQHHPNTIPRSLANKEDENRAMCSNKELSQAEAEVEYSTIVHAQGGKKRQDLIDLNYQEGVEYATIKR